MHPLIQFAKKYNKEEDALDLCRKFREMFLPKDTLEEKIKFYSSLGIQASNYVISVNGEDVSSLSIPKFTSLLKNVPYSVLYKGKK